VNVAVHWSGASIACGAVMLGAAMASISLRPVGAGQPLSTGAATLLFAGAALLLVGLPGMHAAQADVTGIPGLIAYALLTTGVLLLVAVSATPLMYPNRGAFPGESALAFVLGTALTLGLLLTGIVTFQADVLPRGAAGLLLAATAGFVFSFFVAEYLPAIAGQIGTALFGLVLAASFAWIGVALWLRPS
jgi:hypothetical protein